jgi:hypothetical protein
VAQLCLRQLQTSTAERGWLVTSYERSSIHCQSDFDRITEHIVMVQKRMFQSSYSFLHTYHDSKKKSRILLWNERLWAETSAYFIHLPIQRSCHLFPSTNKMNTKSMQTSEVGDVLESPQIRLRNGYPKKKKICNFFQGNFFV